MFRRRFVMNRRLFSYSELPFCDTFPVVVIGKAESVAVAVQSHIVVGEHRSRGDLPIAFRGTVIFSATFPSLTASRSPWWQSSLVLLSPLCADDAVHAAEHSSHKYLLLPHLAEASHHWVRPLRPASGILIGFALQ